MKKYNYFAFGVPCTKKEFTNMVPENWEQFVKDGEYYYGHYKAVEIEEISY
jgi:hypothetical protein